MIGKIMKDYVKHSDILVSVAVVILECLHLKKKNKNEKTIILEKLRTKMCCKERNISFEKKKKPKTK